MRRTAESRCRKSDEMKVIETTRLVLRPFAWGDLEAFHRLAHADPEVAPQWTGRVKDLDEVRDSFARMVEEPPGAPGWAVLTLKRDGTLIGGMGPLRWLPDEDTHWFLPEVPEDAPRGDPCVTEVELVPVLGRDYWGHGYATDAGRALHCAGATVRLRHPSQPASRSEQVQP